MTAPAVHRGDGSGREVLQADGSLFPELEPPAPAPTLPDPTSRRAAIGDERQPIKPAIDLLCWAALGGSTKPARTDRRQKRTWKRRAAR